MKSKAPFRRALALRAVHAPGFYRPIPKNNETRSGLIVVQQHWRHDGTHQHIDISILDSDDKELFRGATAKPLDQLFPSDGSRRMLVRQPTHSTDYVLNFGADSIGEIPRGQYGAGYVKQALKLRIDITKTRPDKISFRSYDNGTAGSYALVRTDKGWLMVRAKDKPLPIIGKHSYKLQDATTLDKPGLYEHKVDGHATRMRFGAKANSLWSWRVSKRTDRAIRYDDKLPAFRDNVYPELEGTVLFGELVFVEDGVGRGPVFRPKGIERPTFLAGRLNSGVWKAREDIEDSNGDIAFVIYDVFHAPPRMPMPVFRHRFLLIPQDRPTLIDMSKLSYGDKLRIMDGIARRVKWIKVPRRYQSGQVAWDKIVIKEGREGLVRKDPSLPTPYFESHNPSWDKIKQRDFLDCRIIGVQPLQRATGVMDKTRVGALIVEGPDGQCFEVGSGLSDYHRRWYAHHAEAVLDSDSYIRVRHDPKLEDRARPHAPCYDSVHTGKSDGVLTELAMYEYANIVEDNDSIYAMKSSAGWRR